MAPEPANVEADDRQRHRRVSIQGSLVTGFGLAALLVTAAVVLVCVALATGEGPGWLTLGLLPVLVLLAAVLAVVFWLVHAGVVRPLRRLGRDTRLIAHSEPGYEVHGSGLAALAGLSSDVDSMRLVVGREMDSRVEDRQRLEEQAEELRRSNAELEQFAYVASHDLQEPLRKVASFCQLLERRYGDRLDDNARQYIDFAVDGAKRMQELINDLLAFSRVGRLHDRREPIALAATLDGALRNLSVTMEEAGAQVTVRSPLPHVTGDRTLLTMVWQNLIGNAVKFRTTEHDPHVLIDAEERDGECRITVSDNGIGIDPQFSDKIFVIFQRLHSRDTYGGTGIGLALCRKIVEHHGGRIWLDTEPGDGARFILTLPTVPGPEVPEPGNGADGQKPAVESTHAPTSHGPEGAQ